MGMFFKLKAMPLCHQQEILLACGFAMSFYCWFSGKYPEELQCVLNKQYSNILVPMNHLQAKNPERMWLCM